MNEFVDALRKAAEHDGYREDIDCGATADYIESLESKLKFAVDALDWIMVKMTIYVDVPVSVRVALVRCGEIVEEALKTIQGKGDGA